MNKPKKTDLLINNQIFKNQTFKKSIFEIEFNTEKDIVFEKCTFKGITSFENINAREILFFDCKFSNVLNISESSFLYIGFNKCKFSEKLILNSNKSRSHTTIRSVIAEEIEINGEYQNFQVVSSIINKINFIDVNTKYSQKDSKIEFLVDNEVKNLKLKSSSNFSNIIFKGGEYETIYFDGTFNNNINFNKKILNQNLFFESSIFKGRIDFREGKFDYVYFYRSSFEGIVLFHGYDILDKKITDISVKDLTIHSCYFEKNISTSIQDLSSLNLSNNNFKQIFNFNNHNDIQSLNDNSLSKQISLRGSNQGNIIIENVFTDVDFSGFNFGNIYFKNIDVHTLYFNEFHNNGNVSFMSLKSGVYLTIQNSITGNLDLLNEDLNIFHEIVIANSNIKGINISLYPKKIRSYSSNPQIGYGITDLTKNNQNLKNIYNQLKQAAKSNGDIDNMNRFKSLEFGKLIKVKKISLDSIILVLNSLSNKHGQSWLRGIIFTLIIAFGFFILYIINISNFPSFSKLIKDYILFISSFPKLQLEEFSELNKTWNVSLVIWLSRIFISYGIYQTVSAFRKYGKL